MHWILSLIITWAPFGLYVFFLWKQHTGWVKSYEDLARRSMEMHEEMYKINSKLHDKIYRLEAIIKIQEISNDHKNK